MTYPRQLLRSPPDMFEYEHGSGRSLSQAREEIHYGIRVEAQGFDILLIVGEFKFCPSHPVCQFEATVATPERKNYLSTPGVSFQLWQPFTEPSLRTLYSLTLSRL